MGPFNQNPFYLSPEEEQRRRMPGGFNMSGPPQGGPMPMAAPSVATAAMAPVPSSAAASPMVPRGTPPPMASPQTGLDRAMASPYAAMAMQGLQNLAGYRTGQMPQTDPFTAYQTAVARNAELAIRRRQDARTQAQDTRAQEKWERDQRPTADFDAFVASRPELAGKPYEDQLEAWQEFNRAGTSGVSNRIARSFIGENGNMWVVRADGTTEDTGVKGSPGRFEVVDVGGVSYVKETLPGGEEKMTQIDDFMQQRRNKALAAEAGAEEGGKQGAQTDADQTNKGLEDSWGAYTAYQDAQSIIDNSKEFLAMLESGQVDTGPINSFLLNWLGIGSEELAALNNEGIMQTLRNLGITNLAPVTEREFAEVAKLWASIGMQEKPNIGSVKQAIKRTERLQERIRRDAATAGGRVRTYGGDAAFNDLRISNPLIAEIFADQNGASGGGSPPPSGGGDNAGWGIKPNGG